MRDSRRSWILPACLALAACATSQNPPVAIIRYDDLDLASPRDRQILYDRIDRVALALCATEAEERRLGQSFNRFDPFWCVAPARKSIERALPAAARMRDAPAGRRGQDAQRPVEADRPHMTSVRH